MINVVWKPQPGSQTAYLTCPYPEVLYEGTRGPGKTDALLMDYLQHVGEGYSRDWRGIIVREKIPNLKDIIARSHKWISQIFPKAIFNATHRTWTFEEGEQLMFVQMRIPADYWNFHGHEYPFVGWEELTNWPTDECYEMLKSCNRCSNKNVPIRYRSTCNPWGVGHGWVKRYFIDPAPPLTKVMNKQKQIRLRVHGDIRENRVLLDAQPDYINTLASFSDPNKVKAWLEGSWDIASGGYFEDIWDPSVHVMPRFDIPKSWKYACSFDWGSYAPASLGIYTISNGEQPDIDTYIPADSVIRVDEWYIADKSGSGLRLSNRQMAEGIMNKLTKYNKVVYRLADPSIWKKDGGASIYRQMNDHCPSLWFQPADNSRIAGWQCLIDMMVEAKKERPEKKAFWVFDNCREFIRTIPTLLRDDKDPEDVDTTGEDHIADETRYLVQTINRGKLIERDLT